MLRAERSINHEGRQFAVVERLCGGCAVWFRFSSILSSTCNTRSALPLSCGRNFNDDDLLVVSLPLAREQRSKHSPASSPKIIHEAGDPSSRGVHWRPYPKTPCQESEIDNCEYFVIEDILTRCTVALCWCCWGSLEPTMRVHCPFPGISVIP